MISRYYSDVNNRYTGKSSEYQNLRKHHKLFYMQCNLANLTAQQGLSCLFYMIDINSIAGKFYLDNIDGKVSNLEEAFSRLFSWEAQSTDSQFYMSEWKNLNIMNYKNDVTTWLQAMEQTYERASQLQDLLPEEYKHPLHLLQCLESSVPEQPFSVFIDQVAAKKNPHSYYLSCRVAINKFKKHSKAFPSPASSTSYVTNPVVDITNTTQSTIQYEESNRDEQVYQGTVTMYAKAGRR